MSKKLHKVLLSSLLGCSLPTFSSDYITENLSTYMRKGAGDQFKISGSIQAGEKITVLDRVTAVIVKAGYLHLKFHKPQARKS